LTLSACIPAAVVVDRPNPTQKMPQVRHDRGSPSMSADKGCSATARFSSRRPRGDALRPDLVRGTGTITANGGYVSATQEVCLGS